MHSNTKNKPHVSTNGGKVIMENGFEVPQVTYGMSYGSCPDGFYARNEMNRLIAENVQLKEMMFQLTGKRWGEDRGAGKFSADGKAFQPIRMDVTTEEADEKIAQLQLCMNVMANVIAEYLTHLKKCAMPYMEAYYKNNTEEIKKHHQAFIPNHVKSIITFQKYVQSVMKDAGDDQKDFKKMLFEQSQEDELHKELESSYDLHFNIIPELQKKDGMTDNETAAYAIAEVAKQNNYKTTIHTIDIDVSKIHMTNEDLKKNIVNYNEELD